jgi:hypothetical protein
MSMTSNNAIALVVGATGQAMSTPAPLTSLLDAIIE